MASLRERRHELEEAPQLRALLQDGLPAARELPQHHLDGTAAARIVRSGGRGAGGTGNGGQALGGSLRSHQVQALHISAACIIGGGAHLHLGGGTSLGGRLGGLGRGLLFGLQLGLRRGHLREQLSPAARLGRRQEQQRVVAQALEQADGAEHLDAELRLGAGLPDHLAFLQHLLVGVHLVLAGRQPDDRLLLRWQLLGLGLLIEILLAIFAARLLGRGIAGFTFDQAGADLRAPEDVRADEGPQLLGEMLLELHGPDLGATHAAAVDRVAEGLDKRRVVAEQPRLRKVHQRPEVLQRVLDRRASEQQAAVCLQAAQTLPQQRGDVLHPVRLVADHDVPWPRGARARENGWQLHLLLFLRAILLAQAVVVVVLAALRRAHLAGGSRLPSAAMQRRRRVVHAHLEQVLDIADERVRREEEPSLGSHDLAQRIGALCGGAVVGVHGPARAPRARLPGPLVQ
mmetsp:Transcript_19036/g.48842  ORF Transcript_19036/g.48842 Transcript_19036/m.48842 type:complete len:459 (-) Transcript_19036:1313-2689(-)